LKRLSISTLALAVTLIASACGVRVVPQATPAIDPVNVQVTALIAASTIMAETQAAIPTATSALPTLAPTNTLAPLITSTAPPTLDVTLTPSPTENPYAVDTCVNQALPDSLTGRTIQIRVKNPTDATVQLTVYLQRNEPQDVCGYRGYAIAAGQTLSIGNLIEGCYSLWAWNPDPNDYFMVTNGTNCLDSTKSWAFDIVPNGSIQLRQ